MAINSVEKRINTIYKDLKNGNIEVAALANYQFEFDRYVDYVTDMDENGYIISDQVLKKFINICMIVYTYSKNSYLLVSDSKYDELMKIYMRYGHPMITTTDFEPVGMETESKWDIIPHMNPDMVGSINKTHDIGEFIDNLYKFIDMFGYANVIFAPKYDGVSACINIVDGWVVNAVTRKDGAKGQNILPLLKQAKNFDEIEKLARHIEKGAIKCEVLCSREDFEHLRGIYANPRSAISGIVGSPKNIKYGNYITIMPLVIKDGDFYSFVGMDRCLDPHKRSICYSESKTDDREFRKELLSMTRDLMDKYHTMEYPFRTDGVVAYVTPDSDYNNFYNRYHGDTLGAPMITYKGFRDDAMSCSYAFKVNDKLGTGIVEYGYMSIGRGGRATPMLKIAETIVNETVVTDVSLSTMSKAMSFDIHIGDEVEIESSGDVIPMLKRVVKYNGGEKLKFSMECPYCGSTLNHTSTTDENGNKVGSNYCVCPNKECPRRVVGRLIEFASRLGMEGFSDESFGDVYDNTHISTPLDLIKAVRYERDAFREKMSHVSGWGVNNIDAFITEIENLYKRSITEAEFINALNIPGIGLETAKKIANITSIEDMLRLIKKGWTFTIMDRMMNAKNIGPKYAKAVVSYFDENSEEIIGLLEEFDIVESQKFIGSFACTDFGKDAKAEIRAELNKRGYELISGFNKDCVALIAANPNANTGKLQKARNARMPILRREDIDNFLSKIR